MRYVMIGFIFSIFCLCATGCETTPKGDPDPIKTLQKWDNWVKENMW